MKKMKLTLLLGLMLLWIFTGCTDRYKTVSIYGVTLGKTLEEVGIKGCQEQFSIHKSPDKACWQYADTVELKVNVYVPAGSPLKDIHVTFSKEKSVESSVESMFAIFKEEGFDELMDLLRGKFGKPSEWIKSPYYGVYNVDRNALCWDVGGHCIVVTKKSTTSGFGFLMIRHRDLVHKDKINQSEMKKKVKEQF